MDAEFFQTGEEGSGGAASGTDPSYILCVWETASPNTGSSNDGGTVQVSVVACRPSTGDVVYDSFLDNHMRQRLETLFLQLQVCCDSCY